MSHRKILYGFQYQDAELIPHPREAETVRRIFEAYQDGQTYQGIADTLNTEQVPFSAEDAEWNKHKIKRLLENPRYAGADGYPPVIDSEVWQAVQNRIQEKNAHLRQVRPVQRLRDRLWCTRCGGKLTVSPRSENGKDWLHVKCRKCKWTLDVPDRDLLDQIERQSAIHDRNAVSTPYAPSAETVRIENAINRGLEKPDHPEEILALILQGVSARYDCCSGAQDTGGQPPKADGRTVPQGVARIDLSEDGTVAVTFR